MSREIYKILSKCKINDFDLEKYSQMTGETDIYFVECKIDWDIEKFCLAFTPDDDNIILSPEFMLHNIYSVKWRMSLELECDDLSRKNLVSFYLEKAAVSKPTNVRASYEVTLRAGSNIFSYQDKNVEFGEHSKHGKIGIATIDEILENLKPFEPDTIHITLYLVAYDEKRPSISDTLDFGLLLLSNDLERLNGREKSYADIKIKARGYIEAHKAILSRNKKFETYFQNAENDVIEIPNIDYKSLYDFVNYLYSGNIKYLLSDPSISTIRCMKHFKCYVLYPFYIPETLSMRSIIDVEAQEFHWTIPDIADKNVVASKHFKIFNESTTWQLKISLKCDEPTNFISIFAEIIGGDQPSYICLEFAILSERGKYFPRRLLRKNGNYDNMGFHDFVNRDSLFHDPELTEYDCVRIVCRVQTSKGSHKKLMEGRTMPIFSPKAAQLYKQLSSYMSELLIKEKYSDIALKCENKIIKAHKCILAARSPGFKRMIENAPPGENTLIIEDVEFDILKVIINYIYTGVFDDLKGEKVTKIYETSLEENLDIPSLKEFLKNNSHITTKEISETAS